MPKATQLTVYIKDAPGGLAAVARALAGKKVNISGMCGIGAGERSPVRLLVSSVATAKKALQAAGVEFTEEKVLEVNVPDKPGALAAVAEKLAAAGINLSYAYASSGGGKTSRLILGVADVAAAEKALKAKPTAARAAAR